MPVISNIVLTANASTIVATWDTDTSADSNFFVTGGGVTNKAAVDNGIAANRTTGHQCVCPGLLPSTAYSCVIISGGTPSNPQNKTTNALDTRLLVTSARNGAVTLGSASNNFSDTHRTFLSNDNKVYVTLDDGKGIVLATPQSPGFNMQVGQITNETSMTGANLTLANYGNLNTFNGTDGPAGATMTNKTSGIFGLNGNLHVFAYRQLAGSSNRYCNWIKTTNHTNSFNNFTALTTFTADGNPVTPNSPAEPVQFYDLTIGLVTPVLYAADDGTLGYNTAGNQIDGGNAFVYMTFIKDNSVTGLFLMRLPRIQFDAQNAASMQYWAATTAYPSPLDFVNDANWSSNSAAAVNIRPAQSGFFQSGIWNQPVFIPAINSYVMPFTNSYDGASNKTLWLMYSAPTPAGPWQIFFTQPNTATGAFYNGFFPFHRDVAANAVTSDIAIKHLFSTSPGGGTNYQINYSTLTMRPTGASAMTQLAFSKFPTIENPLSDGGNFAIPFVFTACSVPSAGVCQGTVVGGSNGAYWAGNGGIPAGDTGGLWPADQYVEVTMLASTAPDLTILRLRQQQGANTAYQLVMSANTGTPSSISQSVYRVIAGSATLLGSFNMTVAAGDVIRMSIVGFAISFFQNLTLITSITDAGGNIPQAGVPTFGLIPSASVTALKISAFAAGASQAAAPTFSPVGGPNSVAGPVTITGPATSTIYYTLDGSTPTRSSSSIASGATVAVIVGQTVKAISSITNFVDSQVSGATYAQSSTGGGSGSGGIGGQGKSFKFRMKL